MGTRRTHGRLTAGASAPEVLIDDVIARLRSIGPVEVSVLAGREEKIEFRLPAELQGTVVSDQKSDGRTVTLVSDH